MHAAFPLRLFMYYSYAPHLNDGLISNFLLERDSTKIHTIETQPRDPAAHLVIGWTRTSLARVTVLLGSSWTSLHPTFILYFFLPIISAHIKYWTAGPQTGRAGNPRQTPRNTRISKYEREKISDN